MQQSTRPEIHIIIAGNKGYGHQSPISYPITFTPNLRLLHTSLASRSYMYLLLRIHPQENQDFTKKIVSVCGRETPLFLTPREGSSKLTHQETSFEKFTGPVSVIQQRCLSRKLSNPIHDGENILILS